MVCELYPLSAKNKIQKQSHPTSNKHQQPLNFCFLKIFPTKRYEKTNSNNQKNKKILTRAPWRNGQFQGWARKVQDTPRTS